MGFSSPTCVFCGQNTHKRSLCFEHYAVLKKHEKNKKKQKPSKKVTNEIDECEKCNNRAKLYEGLCSDCKCSNAECFALRVYTLFCKKHGCERCENASLPQRSCCGNCKCKLRDYNTISVPNGVYCEQHNCPNCGSVKEGGRYCKNCTCVLCDDIRKVGNYCTAHGCSVCRKEKPTDVIMHPTCSICLYCKTVIPIGEKACKSHTCIYPDCKTPSLRQSFPCEQHTCTMCNSVKEFGCGHCKNHNCKVKGCQKSKSRNDLCDDHMCVKCSAQRLEDSEFCFNHKCKETTCGKAAKNSKNCSDHGCNRCGKEGSYVPVCKDCTCVVEGCSQERGFGKFCNKHRCYTGCGRQKDSESNYCIDCKCKVEGCVNSGKPFCETHKCDLCPEQRVLGSECCEKCRCKVPGCFYTVANKNVPFCRTHICSYRGCENRSRINSKTCEKHGCTYTGCESSVKDEGCLGCVNHNCVNCNKVRVENLYRCEDCKCSKSDCQETKLRSDFCSIHRCIFDECTLERRTPGFPYCGVNHGCARCGDSLRDNSKPGACCKCECRYGTCRSVSEDGSNYCKDHRQCQWSGCENRSNGRFCVKHRCLVCDSRIYIDGKFCKEHACAFCDNQCVNGSNVCKYHKCGKNGCLREKASRGDYYCIDHKCITFGCHNEKIEGSNLCENHGCPLCGREKCEHACEVPGCESFPSTGSSYCKAHKCSNCSSLRFNEFGFCLRCKCEDSGCGNLRIGESVCSGHKCEYQGCQGVKIAGSSYCGRHKCTLCSSFVKNETRYCDNHLCKQIGCSETTYQSSGYCPSHKCEVDGCKGYRRNGSRFCPNHG